MILVLEPDTTREQIEELLGELASRGLEGRRMASTDRPLIHVWRGPTRGARSLLGHRQVQALVPTSGPRVRRHGRRFYPYHFIAWCAIFLLMSAVLVCLAGFLPPGVLSGIEMEGAPGDLAPPWYLVGFRNFLHLSPAGLGWLAWVLSGAILVGAFFLPAIDRTREGRSGARAPVLAVGFAVVLGYLLLTLKGLLA
jgi:hypothetical protein